MKPSISIIIPTYNRFSLIGETLDSILCQTNKDWECLVIDDGSSDYTSELIEFYIKKDTRIKYWKRPGDLPKGANACRNFGFKKCRGEYVIWFDDDDLMDKTRLEKQASMLCNTDADVCICKVNFFEDLTSNDYTQSVFSNDLMEDYIKLRIKWLTSPIWKKEFLCKSNQKYDEGLLAAQEWEYHIRLLNEKPKITFYPEVLVYIRKHVNSITFRDNNDIRDWYYFLSRLKIKTNPDINLDSKCEDFLKFYLLSSYKSLVRNNSSYALNGFYQFIMFNKNLSLYGRFSGLIGIISYRFFSRGEIFLKKLKFSS